MASLAARPEPESSTAPLALYPLALTAALAPLVVIHVCYVWAAALGHVPWCLPYASDCVSISATGRQPPESFLFKGVMMPAAACLTVYWWLSARWLESLGCTALRTRRVLVTLGAIAGVGLVVYAVALGSIGPEYRLQRRIGVVSFFGTTLVAQLLVTHLLERLDVVRVGYRRGLAMLQLTAGALLCTGLASVVLDAVHDTLHERLESAFEWTFTTLVCVHGALCARLWKRTGFVAHLDTRPSAAGIRSVDANARGNDVRRTSRSPGASGETAARRGSKGHW